jgi:integrase
LKSHPVLKELLLERKKKQMASGQADRVFPSDPKKAWYTALKSAEITDFRFHDLRHTCCSDLAMAGEGLLKIGRQVGHKSPVSTKRYTHLDTSATEETGAILNNKYYKKG